MYSPEEYRGFKYLRVGDNAGERGDENIIWLAN